MQGINNLNYTVFLPFLLIFPSMHYSPVPVLPGFLSLSILCLCVVIFVFSYNRLRINGFYIKALSSFDFLFLMFAAIHLFILPFSLDFNVSLRVSFEIFISLGFYFCFVNSGTSGFVLHWLRGIPIAVLFASALAVIQFATNSSWPMQSFLNETTEAERLAFGDAVSAKAIGPFLHANSLAIFLTATMPVVLGMMLKERNLTRRAFLLVVFIFGILAALSNMSRGGGLSLCLAFVTMWWVSRRRGKTLDIDRRSRTYIIVLSIIGTIIMAHWLGITRMAYNRFASNDFATRDSSSNLSRVVNLMAGVQVLISRPIVGIGPGTSGKHFVDFGGWSGLGPHNLYLFIASERGIPSLLVFLSAIFLVLKKSRLVLNNSRNWLVIGVFGATIGVLLNGLFESVLTDIFAPFIFANIGVLSYVIKSKDSSWL